MLEPSPNAALTVYPRRSEQDGLDPTSHRFEQHAPFGYLRM